MLEHLVRTGQVQCLEAVEDHENDAMSLHVFSLLAPGGGVNDTHPTIRAIARGLRHGQRPGA
ncbi:hypothetical protein OHT20_37720 [Streptomyces caniferus]|uniref:Tn3 transposase DDE domain-containing protein n=1 Tax=Streptomyces caniferus TaxID=285557 RepID=A0ABZ1VZN3_9ACTN|nr:hypothetical protein [Streptomyces caniferus]